MVGLLCFVLAVMASPFKSKLRPEAENAMLRHQLIVLKRRLPVRDQRSCRLVSFQHSHLPLNGAHGGSMMDCNARFAGRRKPGGDRL
jgi:hypothetical protein